MCFVKYDDTLSSSPIFIHSDLESTLDSVLDKVRGLITSNGGETVKEDNWGKKKLAYQIKREDFAIYVCFDVKLPSDAPLKISNILNITDEVLHYLLIKGWFRRRGA